MTRLPFSSKVEFSRNRWSAKRRDEGIQFGRDCVKSTCPRFRKLVLFDVRCIRRPVFEMIIQSWLSLFNRSTNESLLVSSTTVRFLNLLSELLYNCCFFLPEKEDGGCCGVTMIFFERLSCADRNEVPPRWRIFMFADDEHLRWKGKGKRTLSKTVENSLHLSTNHCSNQYFFFFWFSIIQRNLYHFWNLVSLSSLTHSVYISTEITTCTNTNKLSVPRKNNFHRIQNLEPRIFFFKSPKFRVDVRLKKTICTHSQVVLSKS